MFLQNSNWLLKTTYFLKYIHKNQAFCLICCHLLPITRFFSTNNYLLTKMTSWNETNDQTTADCNFVECHIVFFFSSNTKCIFHLFETLWWLFPFHFHALLICKMSTASKTNYFWYNFSVAPFFALKVNLYYGRFCRCPAVGTVFEQTLIKIKSFA